MALLQDVQQLLLPMSPTGIQILSDRPTEKEGVLRNNGQPGPAEGDNGTQANLLLTDFIILHLQYVGNL